MACNVYDVEWVMKESKKQNAMMPVISMSLHHWSTWLKIMGTNYGHLHACHLDSMNSESLWDLCGMTILSICVKRIKTL